MNGRARIPRGLGATLAIAALLAVLALAWDLRPALPPLPQSFSAPLPPGTIGATLGLVAWLVFVLLDLVLVARVLEFAIRRGPTRTEVRLRRAFAKERPTLPRPRDWRLHAVPLAPPVLRVAAFRELEPHSQAAQHQQDDQRDIPVQIDLKASDMVDKRPGLLLLGPLELTGCKKKQPRRQATAELISYLAMQRRPASRDELLEALWPGDDPRRSAARLYQAVSEARRLLGDALQRDRDTYDLDRDQLRVDLDELDRLRSDIEVAPKDEQLMLLEQALALFRGGPFAGIDALWAASEQRRRTALQTDLLERAGRLRLAAGDASGALGLAETAAALDASNELPVQLAMEAERALGCREAVVERYERLRRELDERFGLQPSPDTKRLYRRLLSEEDALAFVAATDPELDRREHRSAQPSTTGMYPQTPHEAPEFR